MAALLGPDGRLTDDAVRSLFQRAVERFDAGRFHGAHEIWEPLWHQAEGPRKVWLQGLIQVAAALHHFELGMAASFEGLMRSGAEMATRWRGEAEGIDPVAFAASLAPWVAHARRVAEGAPLRAGAPERFPRLRA